MPEKVVPGPVEDPAASERRFAFIPGRSSIPAVIKTALRTCAFTRSCNVWM